MCTIYQLVLDFATIQGITVTIMVLFWGWIGDINHDLGMFFQP